MMYEYNNMLNEYDNMRNEYYNMKGKILVPGIQNNGQVAQHMDEDQNITDYGERRSSKGTGAMCRPRQFTSVAEMFNTLVT
jgi:hypothetical protein